MHDIELTQGNKKISLRNEGFSVTDIRITSPEQSNSFEQIDGISRRTLMSSVHVSVTIEVDVEFKCMYDLDFPIKRDCLTSLTSSLEPFYLREKRSRHYVLKPELPGQSTGDMPEGQTEYADGKRYFVIRSGAISFERSGMNGIATITFETAKLPYAESVGTSMDIHNKGITYDSQLWSYGMNLSSDQNLWKYKFTNTPQFNIYNAGDLPIVDLTMDRVIKITLAQSTSRIKLIDATGNYLDISRTFYSGDVITIDKFRMKANGLSILSSTNEYFPVILPGINTFKVEGITAFTIEFDFRFYYGSKELAYTTSSVPNQPVQDTTPPAAPVVNDVYLASKTVIGTAEESSGITVTFPNGTKATTITSLNGTFSVDIPASVVLSAGQTIELTATDKYNNVSPKTTITVKSNPYPAPTLSALTIEDAMLTITNAVIGKGLKYERTGSIIQSGVINVSSTSFNLNFTNSSLKVGDKVEVYIYDTSTGQQLSDRRTVTVSTKGATVLNLWRSSNKDYNTVMNTTGSVQFTEIFKVIGNSSQEVNVKTVGDTVEVTGNGEEMRFYEMGGDGSYLKPNTTYTLSYNIEWTDTTPGLHTHAWGVGVLYQASNNTRQKFTFTTNAYGKYGYGNGASMEAPASSVLNAMHHSTNTNKVIYSKVTLNEGTQDLGYSAGTLTGV